MTTERPYRLALVCDEPYFDEFTQNCFINLQSQGFEPAILDHIPGNGPWNAVLVIGIHKFMKVPFHAQRVYFGVQTEQLPITYSHSGKLSRNLQRFRAVRGYYHTIFDWNPSLIGATWGGSVFIPYGCDPNALEQVEKKWDVLFIGDVTNSIRRQKLLEFLVARFNFYPDFCPGFGARKAEAIAGSKICLNLHYYEGAGFESPRVFDYLSQGGFTLTERAPSTLPFVIGRDLDDFVDKQDLLEKVYHYLEDAESRERIARQGYLTASQHDFRFSSQVIAAEICRILDLETGRTRRLISWISARLRSDYMGLRDDLSVKKHRIIRRVEK